MKVPVVWAEVRDRYPLQARAMLISLLVCSTPSWFIRWSDYPAEHRPLAVTAKDCEDYLLYRRRGVRYYLVAEAEGKRRSSRILVPPKEFLEAVHQEWYDAGGRRYHD